MASNNLIIQAAKRPLSRFLRGNRGVFSHGFNSRGMNVWILRAVNALATEAIAIARNNILVQSTATLLLTYLRLRLKLWVLTKLLKRKVTRERFLGYNVRFFEYSSFVSEFSGFFITQIYQFKSDKPNPVIIDCGSHIGMSILFFKSLYPESEILGFEADEKTFEVLKHNVESNNLSKVSLFRTAVWNEDGSVKFHSFTPGNVGSSVFERPHKVTDETVEITVPSTRLSSFLNRPIDFLKLNIEGSECEVLNEISPKLGLVRRMFVDFNFDSAGDGVRLRTILENLERSGFRYFLSGNDLGPRALLKEQPYHVHIYAYRDAPSTGAQSNGNAEYPESLKSNSQQGELSPIGMEIRSASPTEC